MFSRSGAKAYKADLKNTIEICNYLGNPQNSLQMIHIAGTNGKGSVSHMLAAIFQHNGYKTGLYTSPHLKDFRERIRIDGRMVSEQFVIDFVEKTREISDKIQPSFFELTFAMALGYFAAEKVDIAVIETGLGGRLDSTNVITPLLSIITNISFDHTDILGDSLEEIAFEKAGIIKPQVPVIIGQSTPQSENVFRQKAQEMHAPIVFSEEKYNVISASYDSMFLNLQISGTEPRAIDQYKLDLNGKYQQKNILPVLAAVDLLQPRFRFSKEKTKDALARVKALTGLFGRWEVIQENPLIVLDVAHNEDGIRNLLLQISETRHDHLHVIIGMVRDKDHLRVLQQFPRTATYYFTQAKTPRALPAEQLKDKAELFQLNGHTFDNVGMALDAAKNAARPGDMIIVCGSVFLVAEVNDKCS